MEQSQKFNKSQGLFNSYYKLTEDKELSVVYIGGSVTDGYGSVNPAENAWAQLIGKWLRERYPNAEITNTRRSIGGTGSYFSVFRYEREIATLKPDLLFIEYAINDFYNGATYEQVVRNSESIVRLSKNINPYIDIVYVLTFNNDVKDRDYDQLRAHRDVALHYGFPVIKLADEFYPMLAETGDDFSKYLKDNVHPNDAGYLFYAQRIWSLVLDGLTKAEEKGTPEYRETPLPEKTLAPTIMENARMVYANEIDLTDSDGWEYQPDSDFSWLGRRYNGRIFARGKGAKFTFEFRGTDVGLATGIGSRMGIVSVTVDDRTPVIVDEYSANPNPKDRIIADCLPYGTHTVTVEVIGKNGSSDGEEFEIGAIFLN